MGIYARLARLEPEPKAAKNRLYELARLAPWAANADGTPPTKRAMQKRLARASGIKLRSRKPDTRARRRQAALIEIVGPVFAQRRRDSHDKGAGEYSLGSRADILKSVLNAPGVQAALAAHPDIRGALPHAQNILKLLAERYGPASRHDYRDHLERTMGFRAEYAGQVLLVDATGFPVVYATGEVRRKIKQWLYLGVDVASAKIWGAETVGDSESDGWHPQGDLARQAAHDVILALLRKMGSVPEWLINDAVSTLTDGLRDLSAGRHPCERLSCGVLNLFSGGARPYVRMAGRPTGGAQAEVAVKTVKGKLAELASTQAIAKEARGLGLQKLTHFQNRLEFLHTFLRAVEAVNARVLTRRGCPLSREQLWQLEPGAAARAARRLNPGLFENVDLATGEIREDGPPLWYRIAAASRVGRVISGRVTVQIDGAAWAADLQTPKDGWEVKPEGKTALIVPSGARAGDDPEAFRLIVIDQEGAGVRYQACAALSAKVSDYYQDLRKPGIGSYRALPWTQADELDHARNAAAAKHRQRVKALKQGTTDSEIESEDLARMPRAQD